MQELPAWAQSLHQGYNCPPNSFTEIRQRLTRVFVNFQPSYQAPTKVQHAATKQHIKDLLQCIEEVQV